MIPSQRCRAADKRACPWHGDALYMSGKHAEHLIASIQTRTSGYAMDFLAAPEVMDIATSQRVQVLIATWPVLDPRGRGRVCDRLAIPRSLDMLASQAAGCSGTYRYRLGRDVASYREQLRFFHVGEQEHVSQIERFVLQRAMRIEWEADQLRNRLINGNLASARQGQLLREQDTARAQLFGLEAVNLFIQDRYGNPLLLPQAA